MSKKWSSIFLVIAVMIAAAGCGPKIPGQIRDKVTWKGEFKTLQADYESHVGEFVILGGRIIATKNFPDASEVTVLQFPTDSAHRPLTDEKSGGRFLIRSDSFIDPEIYAPDKLVTVAGRVTGAQKRPIGDYPYVHPVVKGDLWVWEPRDNSFPRFHFGLGIGKTF